MRKSSGMKQRFTNVPQLATVYCDPINDTRQRNESREKTNLLLSYYCN
jgi:hypothetical protein